MKGWVKTLLDHKSPLERAAGGELGQVLGCGHWGCVVDILDSPYVLKLTVDPTEAHVWAKIQSLIEEERYGDDGFPRLKNIFELQPGIPYGRKGRMHKAFGIVREKVAPCFDSKGNESAFTKQYVQSRNNGYRDFRENIDLLLHYRTLAGFWHRDPHHRRDNLDRRIEQVLYRMGGPVGGPLGESLQMLLSNDVVLNDVHLGNIGWRVLNEVEGVEGYTCLVIFDPGHTPTDKRQLPKEGWRQFAMLG